MQTEENKQTCSLLRAGKCDPTLTCPPTTSTWAQKEEQNQRPIKGLVTQGVPGPPRALSSSCANSACRGDKDTLVLFRRPGYWNFQPEICLVHTDCGWVWELLAKQWGAGGELNVKAMVLNPQLHMVFSSTGTLDVRTQAQIDFGTQSTGSREDRRCPYTRKQMPDSTECCGLRENTATGQPRLQAGTNNWALTQANYKLLKKNKIYITPYSVCESWKSKLTSKPWPKKSKTICIFVPVLNMFSSEIFSHCKMISPNHLGNRAPNGKGLITTWTAWEHAALKEPPEPFAPTADSQRHYSFHE